MLSEGDSKEKLVEGIDDSHSSEGAQVEGAAFALGSTTRLAENDAANGDAEVTGRIEGLPAEAMHAVAMLADLTAFIIA